MMKQALLFLILLVVLFAIEITCEGEPQKAEKILKVVHKIAENTDFDFNGEFSTQLNEWKSKFKNLSHLSVKENECNVHVLIGALPLTGHLNPFIGIAQELARRGCRVSFPLVHSKVKSLEFYANHSSLNGNFHILSMPGDQDSISLAQRADISDKSIFEFLLSIKEIIPTFMNLSKDYEAPLRILFDDPSTRPDLVVRILFLNIYFIFHINFWNDYVLKKSTKLYLQSLIPRKQKDIITNGFSSIIISRSI